MPSWTTTSCDYCASEGGGHHGENMAEGEPGKFEGWAQVWKAVHHPEHSYPGSTYVFKARDERVRNYICPGCLKDDECTMRYLSWRTDDLFGDGDLMDAARARLEIPDIEEEIKENAEYALKLWFVMNGSDGDIYYCVPEQHGVWWMRNSCGTDDQENYAACAEQARYLQEALANARAKTQA